MDGTTRVLRPRPVPRTTTHGLTTSYTRPPPHPPAKRDVEQAALTGPGEGDHEGRPSRPKSPTPLLPPEASALREAIGELRAFKPNGRGLAALESTLLAISATSRARQLHKQQQQGQRQQLDPPPHAAGGGTGSAESSSSYLSPLQNIIGPPPPREWQDEWIPLVIEMLLLRGYSKRDFANRRWVTNNNTVGPTTSHTRTHTHTHTQPHTHTHRDRTFRALRV